MGVMGQTMEARIGTAGAGIGSNGSRKKNHRGRNGRRKLEAIAGPIGLNWNDGARMETMRLRDGRSDESHGRIHRGPTGSGYSLYTNHVDEGAAAHGVDLNVCFVNLIYYDLISSTRTIWRTTRISRCR